MAYKIGHQFRSQKNLGLSLFFLHLLAVNLRQTAEPFLVPIVITFYWVKCREKRSVISRGFVMTKCLAHNGALANVSS